MGGVLLFVMARLLQHAAATARNTEKFYQQVLQNPGSAANRGDGCNRGCLLKEVKAEPKIEAPGEGRACRCRQNRLNPHQPPQHLRLTPAPAAAEAAAPEAAPAVAAASAEPAVEAARR